MAEGGNIQALKNGSDADVDLVCTPCSKDNIREEAHKYCPECQEYLCKTCSKYHSRLTATKEHKLLEKGDAKQGLLVAKTKCHYHPDRVIELYCDTHDMVYCAMCIATDHRSCNGVNKIEDVSKQYPNQTDVQSFLVETKKTEDKVNHLTDKQKQNLSSINEQREAIQATLDNTEARLIEHIKVLKRKALEHLNNKYSALKSSLVSSISLLSSTTEALRQAQEQLNSIHNLEIEQQFVKLKFMRKTVKDANKIVTGETSQTTSIEFKENRELTNFIETSDCLGDITSEKENGEKSKDKHQYKMKAKKEINVKLNADKSECLISATCKLPDGTILLTDYNNRKVKRLDANDNVKLCCNLDASPTGICCIGDSEIAVKMSNSKILFLCVDDYTLSKRRPLCIEDGEVFGLISCYGVLWSSSATGINVYSTSTGHITTIKRDIHGESIFKACIQHMTATRNQTLNVIVTDYSDGAVSLNKDGTVIVKYRDSRLNLTRGVCAADDGTVFLCGNQSNNVVMFSKDGECLGELVGTEFGLKSPVSMCYHKNKNRLIVTCFNTDTLKIIELAG